MKLTFLGAAGTVTGSKYLLEIGNKKILVDCGLFQGLKELRLLNWQEPAFDPSTLDAVLLTHGHLDHTGYLPRLVKLGFRGEIFGTSPTLKIAEIILKDSAKIQEEEAEKANREGYSKHKPALPLYTFEDAEKTVELFCPVEEGTWITILQDLKALFEYNGHILGSTFIQLEAEGKTLVFSGDIGRDKDLLLYPPKKPEKADLLLIESTYGGKVHPGEKTILPELQTVINETLEKGGTIFIPSFAVERTQLLMLILWRLVKEKKIPKVPMIMDSPMGASVLDLFFHARKWHKLDAEECHAVCAGFHVVSDFTETLQLRMDKKPKIVIAGSGMVTGGRILSYLEAHAGNENDTLLLVGYQAEGTRGRKLLDGEKTVKIYGKELPFRMRLHNIDGLSAHADQEDLLLWLSGLTTKPAQLFIVHGEPDQSEAFKLKLKEAKGWEAEIPHLKQSVLI